MFAMHNYYFCIFLAAFNTVYLVRAFCMYSLRVFLNLSSILQDKVGSVNVETVNIVVPALLGCVLFFCQKFNNICRHLYHHDFMSDLEPSFAALDDSGGQNYF